MNYHYWYEHFIHYNPRTKLGGLHSAHRRVMGRNLRVNHYYWLITYAALKSSGRHILFFLALGYFRHCKGKNWAKSRRKYLSLPLFSIKKQHLYVVRLTEGETSPPTFISNSKSVDRSSCFWGPSANRYYQRIGLSTAEVHIKHSLFTSF